MLVKDLFRIDYHRKTLDELFREYAAREAPQEAQDDLEVLLRWKTTDWVSGVSSPIVEITPPLPNGWKLVTVVDTIAVLYPDGSTRPGSKVWLHRAKVMRNGQLRRLDFSPEKGLQIGGWRRMPEPISVNDFIPPQPPSKETSNENKPKEVTNDNKPDEEDAPAAGKLGRPVEIPWEGAKAVIDELVGGKHGPFPRHKDNTPDQAAVVRRMMDWFKEKGKKRKAPSDERQCYDWLEKNPQPWWGRGPEPTPKLK